MSNRKLNIQTLFLLSLVLSSCELMGPDIHKKMPIGEVEQIKESEQAGVPEVKYQELSNDSSATSNKSQPKIELYPGSGQYLSNRSSSRSPKVNSGEGEYSLNFDGADLSEVVKVILTDILAENYVLSPNVSGNVTLQTTHPLSKAELLPTLDMLLQLNNAAMIYSGGLFQIKPTSEVLTGSPITTYNSRGKKIPSGYQVRVVPVKNVAVEELSEIIKPLLQAKTILHVDSSRNMMLVAGTDAELARAMEMVQIFDVDVMKGKSFGMFPLKNVDAAKMISELELIFNGKGGKGGQGFFQFIEIERLNAILAITHQANNLRKIERWVLRLDKANTSSGGGAIVYRVQHVNAVELAETLNEIFSQGRANRDRSASIAPGKKAIEVTNKERSEKPKSDDYRNLSDAGGTSGISDLGEVKVIADEVNNALIIVATAQDYAVVQQVIKQLDVMPLQVLVDATIVSVSLTDELKYGIRWFFEHNGDQNAGSSGGNFALKNAANAVTDAASDLAIGAATGGFGYAFVSNSSDIRAVLNASAQDNKINVVSSPSLLVLNNQEASIQVGDEVPVRGSESTNTGGGVSNVITSEIQMRETGVTLNVKPRVNANGLVIMEIEQSVDRAIPSSGTSNIDSPTIQKRQIKSTVAVQSSETIVLGGLIDENDTFDKTGIPILHQLPLIGPLFGSTEKTKIKTELVVLITPRVVKTHQDGRSITNEFKRKLSGIYEDEIEMEAYEEMDANQELIKAE